MNIYCLRVRRNTAGKIFPFDRVYLAQHGQHTIFQRLFRYALVMPVEDKLKQILVEHVAIDQSVVHPFDRKRKQEEPTTSDDWKTILSFDDLVLAVPVLSKYLKANMPRYLVAAGTYRRSNYRLKRINRQRLTAVKVDTINLNQSSPFPNLAYLQTPEQNIRPICIVCPNYIQHQNGYCKLGEHICYTSLAMGVRDHFKEGMDVPEPPPVEIDLIGREDEL